MSDVLVAAFNALTTPDFKLVFDWDGRECQVSHTKFAGSKKCEGRCPTHQTEVIDCKCIWYGRKNYENIGLVDKIGQPITVGCYIAYGHALGRCAGIRIGKVLDARRLKKKSVWSNKVNYSYEYRITVQGIDDDWDFQSAKVTDRKGTLQFPDRIIVLDNSIVPDTMKQLLENV